MSTDFTDAELEAYLDESLDPIRAADVESALRSDKALLKRLALINGRRNAGVHTLGEIWRRNQIGVPTLEDMERYVNGGLSNEEGSYIKFRMDELKCPFTLAMYHGVQSQQSENAELSKSRREKFFEKSARLLRKDED